MSGLKTDIILNHEGPHTSGDPIRGTLVVETADWLDTDTITIRIDRTARASEGSSAVPPASTRRGEEIVIHTGRLAEGRHEIPWELEAPEVPSRTGKVFDVEHHVQARIDAHHKALELEPRKLEIVSDHRLTVAPASKSLRDRREATESADSRAPLYLGTLGFALGVTLAFLIGSQLDSDLLRNGAVLASLFGAPFVAAALGWGMGHGMLATWKNEARRSGIDDAVLDAASGDDGLEVKLRVTAAEEIHLKELSIELVGRESSCSLAGELTASETFCHLKETMLEGEDVEAGWEQTFTFSRQWTPDDLASQAQGSFWVSWKAIATIDELGAYPLELTLPLEVTRPNAQLLDTGGPVVATETVLEFDGAGATEEAPQAEAASTKLSPRS